MGVLLHGVLVPPCEVGGPMWVGCSSRLEGVEPADEKKWMVVGYG